MDNQQIENRPIENPSTPDLSPKNQEASPQDPPTIISEGENPENAESTEPVHPYAEDLHLLSHPIFSHKEDPIISLFTQPMEELFSGAPQEVVNSIERLDSLFLLWTFGDDEQAFDELQQTDFCNQTACGKLLGAKELYFRCLDCDMSPHPDFYTVLCAACFEKSDHKGHRILVCKKDDEGAAGTCDCGDPEVFNSRGFCTNHQPKPIDIPKLFAEFPSEILSRYQTTIKKTLYAIISFLEILFQARNRPILIGFSFIASRAIAALFEFCIRCEAEINQAFLPIFWTTLKSTFEAPFDVVLHDCQDLKARSKTPKVDDKEAYHQCSCTLLGNTFRVINLLPKEFQELFKRLLVDCIKDASFREYLSIEFTKYLPFLFHKALPQHWAITECSPVTDVYMQLYQKDEILLKVLESGHFENFLHVFKEHIFMPHKVTSQMNATIISLRCMMEYFLLPKYKTAQKLLSTPNLLEELLDLFMNYKIKSIIQHPITIKDYNHQIPYSYINLGLRTERQILMLFEHAFLAIENLPENSKDALIKAILERWNSNLLNAQTILSDDNQPVPCVSFNTVFERVFTGLAISVLKDNLSCETLGDFLKKYLPDTPQNEISEKVLQGTLNTLGLVRYLHITHNYKQGELWNIYYYLPFVFFETDVVTVQAMSLVSNPEKLFQDLTQHFFKYPCPKIQEFFTNPECILSEESPILLK